MSVEGRNEIYMDYMKFIGILCLLVWHASFTQFFAYTTMFFLQMFFFISGYFYKDKNTELPFNFLSKRTKSLYAPYVFYCLVLLSLNNLLVNIKLLEPIYMLDSRSLIESFFSVLLLNGIPKSNQMPGAMWFVPALFFCCIIFNQISYLLKKISCTNYESLRFLSVTLFFALGSWLALRRVNLPCQIDTSFVALPFYYFGYLFNRHRDKVAMNIFYALAAVLAIALCREYGLIRMARRIYQNPPFLLICGCAGIYVSLFVSLKLSRLGECKLVSYVGKNTMAILALHFLAFKFVSWLMVITMRLPMDLLTAYPVIPSANQYWRLAYLASGFFLPLLLRYSLVSIGLRIKDVLQRDR